MDSIPSPSESTTGNMPTIWEVVLGTTSCLSINANQFESKNIQAVREASLVSGARSGNHAAFGELCELHSKKIFNTTLRLTRNREDAEDALQDSFLRAFVHLRSFDGRSSFYTWLTRIAINSALMKMRKNRGSREVAMDEHLGDSDGLLRYEPADRQPNPEQHYVQRERERIVTRAVRNLRPSIRKAVEIKELQERSMKETAQILGISVAAAKARLFHAKVALRKAPRLKVMKQTRLRRAA
jgi:RNA polymerase sigma-70 factor (ECF subfamily)